MGRIDLMDRYIKELDEIDVSNTNEVESLIEHISRILLDDGDLRCLILDYYNDQGSDYLADIKKLKGKLEYDRAILIDEKEKITMVDCAEREKRELEKLRLEVELAKKNFAIYNTNNNAATSTTTVTVSIVQTIEAIHHISNEILTEEEKEELQDKLSAVEVEKASGNKKAILEKVGRVIKYIADKGFEVLPAVLPYLGEISKLG